MFFGSLWIVSSKQSWLVNKTPLTNYSLLCVCKLLPGCLYLMKLWDLASGLPWVSLLKTFMPTAKTLSLILCCQNAWHGLVFMWGGIGRSLTSLTLLPTWYSSRMLWLYRIYVGKTRTGMVSHGKMIASHKNHWSWMCNNEGLSTVHILSFHKYYAAGSHLWDCLFYAVPAMSVP